MAFCNCFLRHEIRFIVVAVAVLEIFLVAGFEAVVSRVVFEEAVIIGALSVFEAFKINLSRLLFFSLFNAFTKLGNVTVSFQFVKKVKLQSPDDIGGVFDIARFLETLERNGVDVVSAIETADNDESGISVALEFLQLANGVVNTELGGFTTGRNDLKIIETNDRSFGFVKAERFK